MSPTSPMIWSATILRSAPVKKERNGNGPLNFWGIFKTKTCREMMWPAVQLSVPADDAESGKEQFNCWWTQSKAGAWPVVRALRDLIWFKYARLMSDVQLDSLCENMWRLWSEDNMDQPGPLESCDIPSEVQCHLGSCSWGPAASSPTTVPSVAVKKLGSGKELLDWFGIWRRHSVMD